MSAAAAAGGGMGFSGDGSSEFWKRFAKIVDLAWSDEDDNDDDDAQPIKSTGLSKSRSFGNLKEVTDAKELGKRMKRSLSMDYMPSVLGLPKNDVEDDIVVFDYKVEKMEKKKNQEDGN